MFSTVDVTIPEGYTTDEIIDLFVNQYGIGTREGFVDVIQNYDFDYWFIDELEQNGRMENRVYRLDGYLFPDTYQFYTSTSEVTVIGKMLKRFSQIFTKEYRNQCAEFGYSVDEMITLASMIEKEAASPSEFLFPRYSTTDLTINGTSRDSRATPPCFMYCATNRERR